MTRLAPAHGAAPGSDLAKLPSQSALPHPCPALQSCAAFRPECSLPAGQIQALISGGGAGRSNGWAALFLSCWMTARWSRLKAGGGAAATGERAGFGIDTGRPLPVRRRSNMPLTGFFRKWARINAKFHTWIDVNRLLVNLVATHLPLALATHARFPAHRFRLCPSSMASAAF